MSKEDLRDVLFGPDRVKGTGAYNFHARPWRPLCNGGECVEVQPVGTVWNVRSSTAPDRVTTFSVAELGQLVQAYLDGEFGPVKVSRL